MTRTVDSAVATALQGGRVVARDFLWITGRDRTTSAPITDGMWSDDYNTTVNVIDPDTGSTVSRSYTGVGNLVSMSDVPLVSNLTVQTTTITLSQVSDHVATLVRTYDCKQAKVEIHRGIYNSATNTLIAAAVPRFVGFVDHIEIKTPVENDNGSVILTCVSHTQEMTRSNADTRSDASQQLRHAGDKFFQDAAVVGDWPLFWGRKSGTMNESLGAVMPNGIGGLFKQ